MTSEDSQRLRIIENQIEGFSAEFDFLFERGAELPMQQTIADALQRLSSERAEIEAKYPQLSAAK